MAASILNLELHCPDSPWWCAWHRRNESRREAKMMLWYVMTTYIYIYITYILKVNYRSPNIETYGGHIFNELHFMMGQSYHKVCNQLQRKKTPHETPRKRSLTLLRNMCLGFHHHQRCVSAFGHFSSAPSKWGTARSRTGAGLKSISFGCRVWLRLGRFLALKRLSPPSHGTGTPKKTQQKSVTLAAKIATLNKKWPRRHDAIMMHVAVNAMKPSIRGWTKPCCIQWHCHKSLWSTAKFKHTLACRWKHLAKILII